MIHRPRRLAVVLGLNQTMSWGVTFYLPAVIANPVAHSLGQPPVMVLGAFSWALLVTGFCAPRVGRWIDAHGGRGALSLSVLVLAAGLVLLAVSPGPVMWYAAWTVLGVGMALGLYDAAFATVGTLLGHEAGPIITGITLIAGLASTVFWSLGAGLIGLLGWRGLLLFYAALQLAVNLPMLRLFVPAAVPVQQAAAASPGGEVRRSQRLTVLCLAGFFTLRWFITSAIAAHVLPLLKGIGLTLGEAVFVAALIGPGQVAGRILEWSVGGRVGTAAPRPHRCRAVPPRRAGAAAWRTVRGGRLRPALRHEQRHPDNQPRHAAFGVLWPGRVCDLAWLAGGSGAAGTGSGADARGAADGCAAGAGCAAVGWRNSAVFGVAAAAAAASARRAALKATSGGGRMHQWLKAIVAVAGGRGFVIEIRGERHVVTAGHCLPTLPPCAAFASSAEKTYPRLLGWPGDEPLVPAECVFADPVADLAVLGPPDRRELPEQFSAYRKLVDAAEPLPVEGVAAHVSSQAGGSHPRQQAGGEAFLLSLDGHWFGCQVSRQGRGLWIAKAAEAIRGGSGSPIVTPAGIAVGVLCTASSAEGFTSGGPNPELMAHLPGWMLR